MQVIEFPKKRIDPPAASVRIDDLLCSEAVMRAWAKIPGFQNPKAVRAALGAAIEVAVRRGRT